MITKIQYNIFQIMEIRINKNPTMNSIAYNIEDGSIDTRVRLDTLTYHVDHSCEILKKFGINKNVIK